MEETENRTSRPRFLKQLVTTLAAGIGVLAFASNTGAQPLNCCPSTCTTCSAAEVL